MPKYLQSGPNDRSLTSVIRRELVCPSKEFNKQFKFFASWNLDIGDVNIRKFFTSMLPMQMFISAPFMSVDSKFQSLNPIGINETEYTG